MRKKTMSLMVVWVALMLGGFVSISYYRQQQFEEKIEKNITELEKTIEEDSMNLKKEWDTVDKSDPVGISDYFRLELFSSYFTHFLDYNKYAQNLEKGLLRGTFQTQAYENAVLRAHVTILLAYSSADDEWSCGTIIGHAGDYCGTLSTYFKRGDQFTWEEFIRSEEYAVFLNEYYHLLETKEEVTFQEAYQQILDYEKGTSSENVYQALLQSYVYLARRAYDDYYINKGQGDFVEAAMDAEIVYSVNESLHNLDKESAAKLVSYTPLSTGAIYIHNSVLDISVVFILSTYIVAVTWIALNNLQKKGIKRVAVKSPERGSRR